MAPAGWINTPGLGYQVPTHLHTQCSVAAGFVRLHAYIPTVMRQDSRFSAGLNEPDGLTRAGAKISTAFTTAFQGRERDTDGPGPRTVGRSSDMLAGRADSSE